MNGNRSKVDALSNRLNWDFSPCPTPLLYQCWGYEFARESEQIISEFRNSRGEGAMFDRSGNWYFEFPIYDQWGEVDEVIRLKLSRDFPKSPFLARKHTPLDPLELNATPTIRNATELRNAFPQPSQKQIAKLYFAWHAPDKRLIEDFKKWLKKNRPFPAITRRGKSANRELLADLKALGAWRLRKQMSAREALAYTEKEMSHALYAKLPDWYEAERRAKSVLGKYF